jgi:hypothetical protein
VLRLQLHNASGETLRVAGALRGGWRAAAEGATEGGNASCLAPAGLRLALVFPLLPHAVDAAALAADMRITWRTETAGGSCLCGSISPVTLLRLLSADGAPCAARLAAATQPPRAAPLELRLEMLGGATGGRAVPSLGLAQVPRGSLVVLRCALADGGERCVTRLSAFAADGAALCPPADSAASTAAGHGRPRALLWAGQLEQACERGAPHEVALLFAEPGMYTLRAVALAVGSEACSAVCMHVVVVG